MTRLGQCDFMSSVSFGRLRRSDSMIAGGSATFYPVALALAIAMGVVANIPEPMYWTTYQSRVPDAAAGAFFGTVESVITGSMLAGSAAGAALVGLLGRAAGAATMGAACAVIALIGFAVAIRGVASATTINTAKSALTDTEEREDQRYGEVIA